MYPLLVADIGGTNARFALVTGKNADEYVLDHVQILSTSEHAKFEDALQSYLDRVPHKPTAACIAIAGPVEGDHIKMTNLSWEFTGSAISEKFGFSRTLLMNDFAAVAAACGSLTYMHLHEIKKGNSKPNANRVVFGPGTGLGVAGLVSTLNGWLPVATEGGHVNIAPTTAYEADVIKAAMMDLGEHVSAENLISGPGLVNLYNAVCRVEGAEPQAFKPADISLKALNNEDPNCVKALDMLVSFLGSFAGNLALTYGAKGGVYIAGGIVPRILDYLMAGNFVERFGAKGKMSHFLTDIPIYLVTHSETAFVGAASWLEQHLA